MKPIYLVLLLTTLACPPRTESTGSRRRQFDDDRIMFPDSDEDFSENRKQNKYVPAVLSSNPRHSDEPTVPTYSSGNDHNNQIPLEFARQLNEVQNVSDLLLHYIDDDEPDATLLIASRFGESVERNSAVMPKFASCTPTPQVVDLKSNDDSSVFYIPACTRIERCGGCCSHTLLSCQPSETELVSFQVLATTYQGGSKLKLKGKEVIWVEKHTKCRCDCKIKEKDCNEFQQYRPQECRCECFNLDELKKCEKSNNSKLWDPNTCTCQCREIRECSTGAFFDQNKCACLPIPVRRRFAELGSDKERPFDDRESYDVSPLGVSPKRKVEN